MEGHDFWRATLLHHYADDCVYHGVVPSMLTTQLDEQPQTSEDKTVHTALQYTARCALCDKNQLGETVRWAVRYIMARCKAGDQDCWIYRAAFADAVICLACSKKRELLTVCTSSSAIHHALLDELEKTATCVSSCLLSGEQWWQQAMLQLKEADDVAEKELRSCANCDNQERSTIKVRCSECKYVYYCGRDCAAAHHQLHRLVCARLARRDFFDAPIVLWEQQE